jgi:hypothetical protein
VIVPVLQEKFCTMGLAFQGCIHEDFLNVRKVDGMYQVKEVCMTVPDIRKVK